MINHHCSNKDDSPKLSNEDIHQGQGEDSRPVVQERTLTETSPSSFEEELIDNCAHRTETRQNDND
jgi:hypothetical protein